MLRMRTRNDSVPLPVNGSRDRECELRPGGMLVQTRTDTEQNRPLPPTIQVRVKYGSIYHETRISSQATFGELKRMLSGPTGLHHEDQKLFYKSKERDSKAFLDTSGVKNKSKIVLQEDPISRQKRYLEWWKNVKLEKSAKSISEIASEVDSLAGQVSALESVISTGGKVGEKNISNLIDILMNQLLKLDAIVAEGDVKLQREIQERRVQKYVETLDLLNLKVSSVGKGAHEPQKQRRLSNGGRPLPPATADQLQGQHSLIDSPTFEQQPAASRSASGGSLVITTEWETFDSSTMDGPSAASGGPSRVISQSDFNWDLL